jgi:predicted SAM-dependent methyltransferase
MKCLICGSASWKVSFAYDKPDKYEKWQGIKNVKRSWLKCKNCGFHTQTRNYPLERLEGIYRDGYRDKKFRGEDIKQAFKRIYNLPYKESENRRRLGWYMIACGACTVIDIGSGLGVWPQLLRKCGVAVSCIEENLESIWFLTQELDLTCFQSIETNHCAYQAASLIHVLEHIEEPDSFLNSIKTLLLPGGEVFIEVPDASEFNYLDKDHDEFNSCHCHFYNTPSLYRLLERNGYIVKDMHRQFYKKRGLTRLMVVAELEDEIN